MSRALLDLFLQSLVETSTMVLASGAISFVAGIPLAILLVLTAPDGLLPRPQLNRVLAAAINGFRSTPFIILLVALIPVTRLIAGTSIGVGAAIVPLSVAATPFFARIA